MAKQRLSLIRFYRRVTTRIPGGPTRRGCFCFRRRVFPPPKYCPIYLHSLQWPRFSERRGQDIRGRPSNYSDDTDRSIHRHPGSPRRPILYRFRRGDIWPLLPNHFHSHGFPHYPSPSLARWHTRVHNCTVLHGYHLLAETRVLRCYYTIDRFELARRRDGTNAPFVDANGLFLGITTTIINRRFRTQWFVARALDWYRDHELYVDA